MITFLQLTTSLLAIETIGAGTNIHCSKITSIFFIEQIIKMGLTVLSVLDIDNSIIYYLIDLLIMIGYGYILFISIMEENIYSMPAINKVYFLLMLVMVYSLNISSLGTYIILYILFF